MAIRKAPELHDWLLGLNFRIFTWQLDIGFWIETAVDWAVSWINQAYDLAETAYNWGKAAWDRAGELYQATLTYIHTYTQSLFGRFETLGSYLEDWFSTKLVLVQDYFCTRLLSTTTAITSVNQSVNSLLSQWQDFVRSTLPSLIDFSWFRSWWGNVNISFPSWWSAARSELREERAAELQPVADQVRQSQSIIALARELFADPEKWLLDRLEGMLARFW